jgi:hypothetical protein
MKFHLQSYLIDIAREEAASKEAELQSLHNSLRYRVGGWVLEGFPPGWRTFVVLWRLTRLGIARMRNRDVTAKASANLVLPEEALKSATLIHGATVPVEIADTGAVWRTDNSRLMALRLDAGPTANTLVVRLPAGEVLRRIARAKLDGTKVIWWPEDSADVEPALVAYARAHAHECREKFEP